MIPFKRGPSIIKSHQVSWQAWKNITPFAVACEKNGENLLQAFFHLEMCRHEIYSWNQWSSLHSSLLQLFFYASGGIRKASISNFMPVSPSALAQPKKSWNKRFPKCQFWSSVVSRALFRLEQQKNILLEQNSPTWNEKGESMGRTYNKKSSIEVDIWCSFLSKGF